MGPPSVGDIVVLPFPFSDGSGVKQRPALVLAEVDERDVIVCQITSRPYASRRPVTIRGDAMVSGSLPQLNYARPEKLFSASRTHLRRSIARIDRKTLEEALSIVRELFTAPQ